MRVNFESLILKKLTFKEICQIKGIYGKCVNCISKMQD